MIDWKNTAILGPCVLESEEQAMEICKQLVQSREILRTAGWCNYDFIFKASFSKANRIAKDSFRGLSIEEARDIYAKIKKRFGVRVLSDVHTVEQIKFMKDTLDVMQIPHSLCRYSEILEAAAATGCDIVVKKGLFMSPGQVDSLVDKITSASGKAAYPLIIERGVQCGSKEVLVDMRNFKDLARFPTCIDASHPAGSREYVEELALAGIVAGATTLFIETHTSPNLAKCDGHHSIQPVTVHKILKKVFAIRRALENIDNL